MKYPNLMGPADYRANRLRPLARRRLITARPPLVDILLRNPYVRTRLVLLG